MKNHFGRFLLVFVMVTLCAFAYWKKQPPLGLDLAGGSSLTYQATAAEGDLTDERMKRAISVIDGRLNATGVTEISINYTQANEIVVELPGRTDAQIKDIKSLIERNGQLQFRIEAEESEQRKYLELRKQSGGLVKPPPQYEWFPTKDGGEALIKTPEKPLLLDVLKLRKKGVAEDAPEMKAAVAKYEEAQRNEVFTGDQLVKTDIQHQTMQTVVYFEFKTERKDYFGAFTEKHVKELMAIILDGKIDSSPIINGKLPGEGVIQGGGTSGFKEAEAKSLAIVLESGSTGIQLALAREELLGPSLGEVAISRGKWSVILGFGLVVGLMVFYYRLPGMVANFALLLNLVILMGILAFFRAALTLPGIAGIVLTLGMAVDANILIFERYREERHRGKAVPEALAAGYDRAMSAIIDSNATTILTAVVLIAMGTGSVKGFGVTLTVGLLASMFTSIFVTRWIFEWAIERGIAKDLVLGPDKKTLSFDYMRNRKWFTGPSFVLMILGAVAYLVRDDYSKRDLEFVGGQEAIVHLASGITPEDADKRVKQDKRYDEASIVTLAAEGIEALPGTTNRFRVRVKVDEFHDSLDVVVRVAKPIGADDAERRVHADKRYETAQVLALSSADSVDWSAG